MNYPSIGTVIGFQQVHSVIDTIAPAVDLAYWALAMGMCCVAVNFLAKLGIPGYLALLIESHISERLLWYEVDGGSKEYFLAAEVLGTSATENNE